MENTICPSIIIGEFEENRCDMTNRCIKSSSRLTVGQISKVLAEHAATLKDLGVTRLAVFGSVLRRQARPSSDVDFLVCFSKPTFDSFVDLQFFLEKLFAKKIDLVTIDALKPYMKDHVLREAKDVARL